LNFGPLKNSATPELDLTPLINIVFLMLVFFMLAGSLQPKSHVEPAKMAGDARVPNDMLVIEVDRNGYLMLSGERIERRDLPSALIPLRSADRKIAIKPDARLAADELLSLSDTLRKAGFVSMTLIVDTP